MSEFNFNTSGAKASMIASGFQSIGSIFQTAGLNKLYRTQRQQMIENARVQGNQVVDVMGKNALQYLKNGVNLVGSATETIRQTGETGYQNIVNQIDYQKNTLKQQLKNYRNQVILQSIGSLATVGIMGYQGQGGGL
jgi:hypothetical protein